MTKMWSAALSALFGAALLGAALAQSAPAPAAPAKVPNLTDAAFRLFDGEPYVDAEQLGRLHGAVFAANGGKYVFSLGPGFLEFDGTKTARLNNRPVAFKNAPRGSYLPYAEVHAWFGLPAPAARAR